MDRRHVLGAALLVACKAELGNEATGDAGSSPVDSGTSVNADAGPDAMVALGPWGTPTAIPGASTGAAEDDCTLSSNKLELYFKRSDSGDNNLYVMTRASVTAAWSAPTALTGLNTGSDEESPRLTPDDLTMYFGRGGNIFRTTRASTTSAWGAPTAVASLNTTAYEKWASVCSNGYVIVSRDTANNDQDLFEGDINNGATTPITAFNSDDAEQGNFLTADCLRVYFQSNRDGQFNMYTATRLSTTTPWTNPTAMSDFNTAQYNEEDPWVSTDETVFVYASTMNGNKDLFISTR